MYKYVSVRFTIVTVLLVLLTTMFTVNGVKGQSNETELTGSEHRTVSRYLTLGPSLASYKGDLSSYNKFAAGFELNLIQNKDKRIRASFNFSSSKIVAQTLDNVYSGFDYTPLYFVQTRLMSISYGLNYFFVRKKHLKSYAGLGFGIFQFRPMDEYDNEIYSIPNGRRMVSEEYQLTKTMLPVQIGAIYTMNNDIGFLFNFKWMNTGTDYLDNMSRLANPNDNDNVLLINIGLVVPFREPSQKPTESK